MSRSIGSINTRIGDLSFLARYGRTPTPADDATDRVATHVGFAQRVLRSADVRHLPALQRARRARALDVLADYVGERRFPEAECTTGFAPVFVDGDGCRCAVAALVEDSAGPEVVRDFDAGFHAGFVDDIAAGTPELAAWGKDHGFTVDELALIQPAYHEMQPSHVVVEVATEMATSAANDGDDMPTRGLVGVGVTYRGFHNYYLGDPLVAVDGAVGMESGGRSPYRVTAKVGSEVAWRPTRKESLSGWSVGLRLDGDGERVPQAWTVPLDGYHYGLHPGGHVHIGVLAGLRPRVAGNQRDLGWSAGVDVVATRALPNLNRWTPRALHVGVGVERIADLTLIGLTLAITTRDHYDDSHY